MRVGILGGTFDPIHLGHLIVAEEARIQLGLDQVVFIPTGQPWLKAGRPLTSGQHRLVMVRLAVASNPHFRVGSNEVDRPGPTYTVDTLVELRRELGTAASLYFILGQDALAQFHRWKEPGKLLELCHLVVVQRPGYGDMDVATLVASYPQAANRVTVLPVPLVDISGTDIRRRVAAGVSFRYQVPEEVEQYILRHGLYQDKAIPRQTKVRSMEETAEESYLTMAAAAKLLDVSSSTVRRWIGKGKLQAYRIGPRTVRVKKEDILAMVPPTRKEAMLSKSRVFGEQLMAFAGIWKNVDTDGVIEQIYRARHEAPPSTPVS
jgi:nicotinate-nucleotide adenylyltransferase